MTTDVQQQELNSIEIDMNSDQFLTFMLGGDEYGVDILRVQEIKGWEAATDIPNTPDFIHGVMNLRGTIVPVIDLRRRFGMEAVEYTPTTVVIVLKIKGSNQDRVMGFIVDAVSDVYNIEADELKEPPDFGTSVDTEFVKALATVDDKMVILLDIDHLVEDGLKEDLNIQGTVQ